MREYITIDEAAELLGLSAREVNWLIRSGDLPGVRAAAAPHWRVERGDLAVYMERHPD